MSYRGTALGCALIALLVPPLAASVHAAASVNYPNKPIRLIVPFAPGSSVDILARMMAQRLTEALGQPVVIDNRASAGGTIGVETVAKSNPDGYTLVMGTIGTHAINPGLYTQLPYDPIKGFAPITLIAASPNILLVHPAVPAASVKELVTLARAKAGQLNYASGGIGGSTHLSAELFKMMTKISLVHVPYRGGGPALTAILGGEVSVMFNNIVSAMPHVKTGRLRALGVTSRQRSPVVPDLVTVAEAGIPGYEIVSWYGVLGPAATPAMVVARLNQEIREVMTAAATRSRLATEGVDVVTGTPAQFATHIRSEIAKWGNVIREAGIRAE